MPFAVTHVMSFYETPEYGPLSGAENHLLMLMEACKDADMDIELIALIQRDGPILQKTLQKLRAQGVTVTTLFVGQKIKRLKLLKAMHDMGRVRRHRILHAHLELASAYARVGFYFAGARRIVNSWHNDAPHEGKGFQKIKWKLLDLITSANIAITDAVRRHLIERVGLNAAKVITVHYGIYPPKVLLPKVEARQKLGIDQNVFCLGFVGRLTLQKNIPLLLEAMTHLPDNHLCLIGAGEEQTSLEQHAQKLGLRNVTFKGFQPDAADLMTAFDILILPSHWEGLGLVLLEAMIRRVAAAGSRNGAIPEVLDNGKYGFLFDTAHDLVEIIRNIQREPGELNVLAEKSQIYVQQNFTIDAMTDKTRKIYASI